MATEFKLNYSGSEINRKLATVDETKRALESNYYTSTEVDDKIIEVSDNIGAQIDEVNSNLNTALETNLAKKADLVEGKVPVEQIPDGIVDLSSYYTKTEIDTETNAIKEDIDSKLDNKADLVDGKIPVEQLPDDIGAGGGLTEVAWEDIKNKPFGEMGLKYEWDGDTSNVPSCPVDGSGLTFYKVSDKFISQSDIVDASIDVLSNTYNITSDMIFPYESGSFAVIVENTPVLIGVVQPETLELFGLQGAFAESGLWFAKGDDDSFWLESFEKDYSIEQIDKKYLPSDIGTWEAMPDKPFGEEGWSIEWDGNPLNTMDSIFVAELGGSFYKISDNVILPSEILGCTLGARMDSQIMNYVVDDDLVVRFDTGNENSFMIFDAENGAPLLFSIAEAESLSAFGVTIPFPSSGTWFMQIDEDFWTYYVQNITIKQIDSKYLPINLDGSISLDNYYTKSETDNLVENVSVDLSNYYTKSETNSLMSNYYTKSEMDDMIGDCDSIINSINTLIGGEDA